MDILNNRTILLGITGGISAYKSPDIASKLRQSGANVDVVMTESATKFITPLTLQSVTGRQVYTDMWAPVTDFKIDHISLAESADLIVIAPATANIIAHLASGMADDLLTCTVLATKAPVILSPAMNDNMFNNPITQENISKLKDRGFIIIEPGYGRLASGKMGQGRLPDTSEILDIIRQVLARSGDLSGKHIVVTAGGTREAIDPVRFIGNRSSGKMGFAITQAARDRGAEVKLITTMHFASSAGIEVVSVETAIEMKEAVEKAVRDIDVLIMAAAVADYQADKIADNKIKKGNSCLEIKLVKTLDILSGVKGNFIKVGFAAESENIVENASVKLKEKGLDLIVANDITAKDSGFGTDTNKVTIIDNKGKVEELPLLTK
ncbi:MAG: bifunctional phosphopantothenoylcysteine decarboxylase/phosphopantothenate--cysteine ligase CoaBC, partial [Dehalococcoidales bacterium]|nr:bifunctional phosphopantothenoylcysteine decarboxylase/phosphopantothenate--cysteine ligase CoaBC [Dehalococcoidales bacterium]